MKRRTVTGAIGALSLWKMLIPAQALASALGAPGWSPLEILDESSVFIDVNVGGVRRTALLDTGAAVTILGQKLASELKLSPVGSRTLRANSGVGAFNELPGFEAEVGGVAVRFSRAVSANLDEINSSMSRRIDLVIGHDLFRDRLVDLDIPAGRWRLLSRPPSGQGPGREVALTFGAHSEPTIPVSVEGRPPAPAILDLGASAALTMSRSYAAAHDLLRSKRTSTAAFASVNGVTITTSVMMDGLTVAGTTLSSLPAEVVDHWLSPDIPLNVGLPVWRRFRILFDFSGGRVWLSPSLAEVAKPFPEDHAGLGVAFVTDRLIVKHVAARSPAAAQGWTEGEEIVAVDGRPVAQVNADDRLRGWRDQAPGTTVMLTLSSGVRRRLVLADYY